MKNKFWLVLLIGLGIFLFWGIKYSKVEKAEFLVNFDLVKLERVIDGDTIEVIINNKKESVRLIGIDAPELTDSSMKGKTAIESREYLKKLLQDKKFRLEADETQEDRDVYQRLLRYIFLEDGTLVNKKMIESKMADEHTYKKPYKYQREFREIEKEGN